MSSSLFAHLGSARASAGPQASCSRNRDGQEPCCSVTAGFDRVSRAFNPLEKRSSMAPALRGCQEKSVGTAGTEPSADQKAFDVLGPLCLGDIVPRLVRAPRSR